MDGASIPFLVWFFGSICCWPASLLILQKVSRKRWSPTCQLRTRLFLRALLVASLAMVEFLPTFGVPIPLWALFHSFPFVFLGAPVIWRYHLVDITPAFAAQEVINI